MFKLAFFLMRPAVGVAVMFAAWHVSLVPDATFTGPGLGLLLLGLVALRPVARTFGRRPGDAEGILIVGSQPGAAKLYAEIIRSEPPDRVHIASTADIGRMDSRDRVARIVVADGPIDETIATTLIDCKLRGTKIERAVESFEKLNRKIWIEGLSPDWFIFAEGFQPSILYLSIKRAADILLAATFLILTWPLMIVIAAIIKFDSAGPAVFSQERVGLFNRRFILYKFRSMRVDAEEQSGPMWAQECDHRITMVGKILRKTRLDELPQIFNVLRGDMSFVGPRPERPYFVDLLKSKIRYYDVRHYVKPGITGWAQVNYRYGASVEDSYQKLQYDLYYTKNASLRLDLLVLLKTLRVVLSGEGR